MNKKSHHPITRKRNRSQNNEFKKKKLLTSKLVNKLSSTHVRESHFDSKRSYLAHGFPASQTLFFQVSLMITGLNWAQL